MNRRTFIQATSAAAGALTFTDVPVSALAAASPLERTFRNPPVDAGLSIVYHWTGGAVTREGITADMEDVMPYVESHYRC